MKNGVNMRSAYSRIPWIDVARGIALVAMAIFHFTWDLDSFGLIERGTIIEPQWKYFARAIASSFLILVGLSSFLAHQNEFQRTIFIKRTIMVASAAAMITLITWFATPKGFIFFGILHNIALSSVLVLIFLRLPTFAIAASSLFFLTGGLWLRSAIFDPPLWWWTGLSQFTPKANDYVPMFPWFGWVLAGLVFGRLLLQSGFLNNFPTQPLENKTAKLLRFFGQNSLIFYLVHQPILIAGVYAYARFIAGI